MDNDQLKKLGNLIQELHNLDDMYYRVASFLCWKNKRLFLVALYRKSEPSLTYIATAIRNANDAMREIGSPCDSKEEAIKSLKFGT